jgi:predicted PurR-regulated permease PerM
VRRPTPIVISRLTWNLLVAGGVALFALLLWAVPTIPAVSLAGFVVALVLSFPADFLSRFMPRAAAILLSLLILLTMLLLVAYVMVPILVSQVGALITAFPDLVQNLERSLTRVLSALYRRDLLPDPPEVVAARLASDLRDSLGVITNNMLGRTVGLVFGTFS